ncbi:MAG: Lsr2 protein, partial [Spirosoma sp.]|nr:Lsr2 protein [Spirosoma sp.]
VRPSYALAEIKKVLQRSGRLPCPAAQQLLVDCPVKAVTEPVFRYAAGGEPRDAFERHLIEVYGTNEESSGRGRTYMLDPNVDSRADQLAILCALPDRAAGMLASALAALLPGEARRGQRAVLDGSAERTRAGRQYPPAVRRLPTASFPGGWHGPATAGLPDELKRVGLPLCPHADCPEQYATVLCPSHEVLALGSMTLCQRCRRAATDLARYPHASAIVFPSALLDWATALPRRAGRPEPCAAGCARDVGFGAGMTWRWDGTAKQQVWHDDDCRAGTPSATFTRCAFAECRLDEGGGRGSIRQSGRGRRVWHARDCSHAQDRLVRRSTETYIRCGWSGCTLDDGAGPGSVAQRGKHRRTHDDNKCRAGWRREQYRVAKRGPLPG